MVRVALHRSEVRVGTVKTSISKIRYYHIVKTERVKGLVKMKISNASGHLRGHYVGVF